jgi:hypothetical protein
LTLDLENHECLGCGGRLHPIGEATSEMLDWVPAQLRVVRIRRPKYGCRACGTIHQAPAPDRPIAKGLATAGLLAQVLVSKYCDHTPLYRQAQILARHGARVADRPPKPCAGSPSSTPWKTHPRPARRKTREADSRPLIEVMKPWLETELRRIPNRGRLADAIDYALARWPALCHFLDDGRIELDTNPVERASRPVAFGRKNHLFAGSIRISRPSEHRDPRSSRKVE